MRWSLRRLRARALKFDDAAVKRRLATGQKRHGVLPGKLSQLPGVKDPPLAVQLPKKPDEAKAE